jgi:hypothetical protein
MKKVDTIHRKELLIRGMGVLALASNFVRASTASTRTDDSNPENIYLFAGEQIPKDKLLFGNNSGKIVLPILDSKGNPSGLWNYDKSKVVLTDSNNIVNSKNSEIEIESIGIPGTKNKILVEYSIDGGKSDSWTEKIIDTSESVFVRGIISSKNEIGLDGEISNSNKLIPSVKSRNYRFYPIESSEGTPEDKSLEYYRFQPFFIKTATHFSKSSGMDALSLKMDITPDQFGNLRSGIWKSLSKNPIIISPNNSVEHHGNEIFKFVDFYINKNIPNANKLLKQWLCAEAIVAFVANKVMFGGTPELEDSFAKDGGWTANLPNNILKRNGGWAKCCGFAMLTRDLTDIAGKSYGLRCEYVGGWARDPGKPLKQDEPSNHAWNLFFFDTIGAVPSDSSLASGAINQNDRRFGRPDNRDSILYCLPVERAEWEMFLARNWGYIYPRSRGTSVDNKFNIDFRSQPITDPLTSLDLYKWKQIDTTSYFRLQESLAKR